MRALETKHNRRRTLIGAICTALIGTFLAHALLISAVEDDRIKEIVYSERDLS